MFLFCVIFKIQKLKGLIELAEWSVANFKSVVNIYTKKNKYLTCFTNSW